MDRGDMSRSEYEEHVRALRENMWARLGAKKKYGIGEDGEGIVGTKEAALVEEERLRRLGG